MRLRYRDVIVQKLITSPRAKKYYKYAQQRKPIGSIDLRGVSSVESLRRIWKEMVGKDGTFALLARDVHGNLGKSIGIIRIDRGVIEFKDKRCILYSMINRRKKTRQSIVQDDFVISGR